MHGFAVVQGDDPQDPFLAVARVDDLTPETDAPVELDRSTERGGQDRGSSLCHEIGTFA